MVNDNDFSDVLFRPMMLLAYFCILYLFYLKYLLGPTCKTVVRESMQKLFTLSQITYKSQIEETLNWVLND